jgi:hypothetical protein
MMFERDAVMNRHVNIPNRGACSNCGQSIAAHAVFCPRCGRNVNLSAPAVARQSAVAQPVKPVQPASPVLDYGRPLPKVPTPRPIRPQKTASGFRGGWVAILVAFAAVRACSTFERGSTSRVQYPPTPAPAIRQYSAPAHRSLYSPGSEPPQSTSQRYPELKAIGSSWPPATSSPASSSTAQRNYLEDPDTHVAVHVDGDGEGGTDNTVERDGRPPRR